MKQTKTIVLFTPSFTSAAVIKDILAKQKSNLGEEKVYSAHNSRVQSVLMGLSGQELSIHSQEQRGINPPMLPTC